ncbi:hypothetical protein [Aeromicrobium sp. Leaf291]|uniref:hypothetical protein n=1 Tax=Aeromicrobium sp. Leaf291 TaxID=1736325 RepID=UPI0006FFB86A|nr:hypothetical protein [Aeromicrobium sp. Leaf291]KQP81606.1 hypothetical protein ASF35_16375 [Aeromicrobium sp. Leaf291]
MSNTLRLDGDRPAFPILDREVVYVGSLDEFHGGTFTAVSLCPCGRCQEPGADVRFVLRHVHGQTLLHVRQSSLDPA